MEPFCGSVGFRLADKDKTGVDAPILSLFQEVVLQIRGIMAGAEREIQRRIAAAVFGHIAANAFDVPKFDC